MPFVRLSPGSDLRIGDILIRLLEINRSHVKLRVSAPDLEVSVDEPEEDGDTDA